MPKVRFNKLRNKPEFQSELDWSPESWFGTYRHGVNRTEKLWSDEDELALASHLDEYNEIERLAKENGTWLKNEDGSDWDGSLFNNDARAWVMMQSKAFKNYYDPTPWYSGQGDYPANNSDALYAALAYRNGDLGTAEEIDKSSPYQTELFVSGKGDKWGSSSKEYARHYAEELAGDAIHKKSKWYKGSPYAEDKGWVYQFFMPKDSDKTLRLEGPKEGESDLWTRMSYDLSTFNRVLPTDLDKFNNTTVNYGPRAIKTDDIVEAARNAGYNSVYMNLVYDGIDQIGPDGREPLVLNESVDMSGIGKVILGSNGNLDPNVPFVYAYNKPSTSYQQFAKFGTKLNYLNYIN